MDWDRTKDDSRELELKLEVEPDCDRVLLSHPLISGQIGKVQNSVSTYYDTDDHGLRDAGLTLRIRQTGDRFVQTVKAGGAPSAGLFDRDEWEVQIAGPEPELDRLEGGPAPLARPEIRDELRPLFQTLVDRRAAVIDHQDSRIELVFDRGEVVADGRRESLFEIELELIQGSPSALFDVARQLQTRTPLRLGVMSKSERGNRLMDGSDERAMKAEPVALSACMSVNEAFRTIAFACLRHFRANEPLVIEVRDADALHQSRVALRRLRSAFSLFRPILKGGEFDRFRDEVRTLACALGHARNLDVLMKRLSSQLSDQVHRLLTQERTRAYDSAIASVRAPATAAMLIDLAEWIALGERKDRAKAGRPVGPFADKVLDRFWRKMKPGRRLRRLGGSERHDLRIAGKKLRYAGDFFTALYAAERTQREAFLGELATLQDALGALNDLATAEEMEAQLAEAGIILPAADAKQEKAQRRELIGASAEAFGRLESAGPFWRTA